MQLIYIMILRFYNKIHAFYQDSTNLGIGALLCSSFVTMLGNFSVKNVSVTLWCCLQFSYKKCL